MLLVYIILIIISLSIFYVVITKFIDSRITNVYGALKSKDVAAKIELNKLKVVETDDRMIRLIKDTNTNFTELGMAIQKSSVDVHRLDEKYPGLERDMRAKFKAMTTALVNETKTIDPVAYEDDSDVNRDKLRIFRLNWYYYSVIYDAIYLCKNYPNSPDYNECYNEWHDYYKDKTLEELREFAYKDIISDWDVAINDVSKRKISLDKIKKRITDLFP